MKYTKKIILLFLHLIITNELLIAQTCGLPDVTRFGTQQTVSSMTPYWDSIPGATSYNLEYRIRNISAPYSAPISTNTNSLTLTNLTPSTNYEFIVQSVCSGGSSSYSSSGWFTTPGSGTTATISRGPYMTLAKSDEVTIQWKTNIACNSEVNYGTSPGNLTHFVNHAGISTYHSITLNNLQPNTKYYYSTGVIGTPLQSASDNYFLTAPMDNDSIPMRFWVTGDFGNGSSSQEAVRDAFANYTSGNNVNGWIWLGDNAYANGTDQEYQDKVFEVYPSQFKNIPVFPALGNHDYGQVGYLSSAALGTAFPYFDIFTIPTNSGTEKYYSTNYGNIHFIALDSYGSYNTSSSDMYRWLEEDLSNNTQQFTIVYFHHAPYSKGSHNSDNSDEMVDMRNNIIPLLESNGVDLVLGGHSHAYERSKFIKGHFGTENSFSSSHIVQDGPGPYIKNSRTGDGTIYLVCGVSAQIESTTTGYPHNAMYYSNSTKLGSLILDVSGNNLTGRFLTSSGSILDEFTIIKPPVAMTASNNEILLTNSFDFSVYPNPTQQEFNIHLNEMDNNSSSIKITNIFGQTIFEKTIEANANNKIIKISKRELNNCSAGIYHISCSSGNTTITKALIIE